MKTKMSGVAILLLDKIDFETNTVRDKEGLDIINSSNKRT